MVTVLLGVAAVIGGLFWLDRRAYWRRQYYTRSIVVDNDGDGGTVYVDGDCDDVIDCDNDRDDGGSSGYSDSIVVGFRRSGLMRAASGSGRRNADPAGRTTRATTPRRAPQA